MATDYSRGGSVPLGIRRRWLISSVTRRPVPALELDPVGQAQAREIFSLAAHYSVRHIARVMTTQYGQSWSRDRIHGVLRNRFYVTPPPTLEVVPAEVVFKALRALSLRKGRPPVRTGKSSKAHTSRAA